MIVVLARFSVAAKDLGAATELARTLAAETVKEPGCLLYAVAADLADGQTFRLSEWWQDAKALNRHFDTQHMRTFRHRMRGLAVTGIEIKRFEVASVADLDPRQPPGGGD